MKFSMLTIPAAALALALSATPAHAQFGALGHIFGQDRDDYRGNARQIAYDNGYREGMDHGQQSARNNRPFDLEHERDYRNADEGYRREYGNKDRYREDFRRGFAEGYRAAYDRYGYTGTNGYYGGRPVPRDRDDNGRVYGGTNPGYGGYGNYGYGNYGYRNNFAFNNGVNDGIQKGQEDARNGKSFDPTRQKWYRSGDRNYNDHMGVSRDEYRNQYRQGFQQGYDQGYRQYRRW